ncbi:MAG: type II secretion system protein [bacterium]
MLKNKNGFTLMELVVVMFAMTIITVAIAPFIRLNVDSFLDVRKTKFSVQTSRIAFNKIFTELKQNVQNNTDLYYITGNRIRFNHDVLNWVEYRLISYEGNLYVALDRQGWGVDPEPLISGVKSFQITYYDALGSQTTNTSEVQRIMIQLVLQDPGNPPRYPPRQMSLVNQYSITRF